MDFSKMSLKDKVLQTFVVTIREINKHGGPEKFFKDYHVGGMYYGDLNILYDENGLEMGTQMTREKLQLCRKCSEIPLLVCADEGQLKGQKEPMGAGSLLGSVNEKDCYDYGTILGMQMNEHQVDWILGPAVDITAVYPNPFSGGTDNPETAVTVYGNIVEAVQNQGICATSKHFPGLGAGFTNMHFAPGKNELDFDTWMKTYGYVYKEMFKKGVMCVMNTHVTLRSYDDETHDGFYPIATYSPKLTTELLKEKLGFEGAVVTDALIMGGMATGDLIAETVQAFKAGADLLLWPPVEAADVIVEKLESGEIPMERLDDALKRINRMREFREKFAMEKKPDVPSAEFADKTLRRIKENGICEHRNKINIIPIKDDVKKFLIVDVSENGKAADLLKDELVKRGYFAEVKTDIYDVPSRVCWQDDIDALQSQYDMVIFSVNTDYETSWGVPFMRIWASHLFKKDKKIIVNYGTKLFASEYFPEDPTFIQMNCNPSESAVSSLVDGLFGKIKFTGNLF